LFEPILDWTVPSTAELEWPAEDLPEDYGHHSLAASEHGCHTPSSVSSHASSATSSSTGHAQFASMDQSEDMKVLGVDLDVLMQDANTFNKANPFHNLLPESLCESVGDAFSGFCGEDKVTVVPQPAAVVESLHHMACHDYTNKVTYNNQLATGNSIGFVKSELVTEFQKVMTANSANNDNKVKANQKTNRVRRSTQGQRKATKPKQRAHKSSGCDQDKDYLAHGTGIPR
jgi:hypothetical protein